MQQSQFATWSHLSYKNFEESEVVAGVPMPFTMEALSKMAQNHLSFFGG